jgi:type VI secretion system lysozyme-like protein
LSIQPKPVLGLRVPLFDRLVDSAPEVRKEHTPLRIYGREALFASIARDLGRLLNTRSNLPSMTPQPTVLDYGIPDFSHIAASDELSQRGLAETIRQAIQNFEPRLEEVVVTFARDPSSTLQLLAFIAGKVRLGTHIEPITFSVLRHTTRGEVEVIAPETPPPHSHG